MLSFSDYFRARGDSGPEEAFGNRCHFDSDYFYSDPIYLVNLYLFLYLEDALALSTAIDESDFVAVTG